MHACVRAWASFSTRWHFKWTKKGLSLWPLSIPTETSVPVLESMFWIPSLFVWVCLRMWKMSKCNRNLPVIAASSSQQLLTTGVSALSDVESGIQDFFGHPIITSFAFVSGDERETMHESALLLYVCAHCKIIYQREQAEIVNRCQGWTIPLVWYLNSMTLERFVQDLDLCQHTVFHCYHNCIFSPNFLTNGIYKPTDSFRSIEAKMLF